ncbi:hypothetical protein N431DRAFT_501007 [Stipitochalara longipes BDJ]|nr:hypothetical protein N431DRAFT_501007 [Stipitochalara longipes BDJ]
MKRGSAKEMSDFQATTKETDFGVEPSYPLGPLEGRTQFDHFRFVFGPAPGHATTPLGPLIPTEAQHMTSNLRAWAQGTDSSAAGRDLEALPQQRALSLAEGKNSRGLEPSYAGKGHKEGGLGFLAGVEQVGGQACTQCQTGRGPFSFCVVVVGFFSGSCASCHYHGKTYCSLRK